MCRLSDGGAVVPSPWGGGVGGRTGSGDPTRRRRRARVRMCFHFRSRGRLRGPTGRVDSVSMFLCLLHGRRDAGLDGMAAGGRLVATGQRRGRSRARATTPVAMGVGRRAGGRPQPRRPTRKHAAVGCPRPSTVWPCPRSPHTKEKKSAATPTAGQHDAVSTPPLPANQSANQMRTHVCTRDPRHGRHSPCCGTATAVWALPVFTNSASWPAVSTARQLYASLSFVGTQLCTPQTKRRSHDGQHGDRRQRYLPVHRTQAQSVPVAYRWCVYVAPVRRLGSCLRVLGTRRQTKTKRKKECQW